MPNETENKSNFSDVEIEKVWQSLIIKLATEHVEFPTTPLNRRTPKWFRAKSVGHDILIDFAKDHHPSCEISSPRRLTLTNFKDIYPLYLRRINGERVSAEVTAKTLNQVYYFSLIKHLG